ncbi:hypothetical protein FKM82_019886 [Ascaphus truei]
MADTASKNSLCNLPFEGEFLFGNKLDAIINKAFGGKSTFLPLDTRNRRYGPFHQTEKTQYREARTYRPGKTFSWQTSWRGGQNKLFRGARGRASLARAKFS